MKILLINPPRIYRFGSKGVRLGLPLGLLYIAAVLEEAGFQVKVLDCLISPETKIIGQNNDEIFHGLLDDVVLSEIKRENPDIVGITNPFTAQIKNAIEIASLVKKADKNIITVIGGPHISTCGQDLLKNNPDIDVGVIGEGEYVFLELVKKIVNKRDFADLKSIIYRNRQGLVIQNEFGGFINDLDKLPYPAYHLIDMERYFNFLNEGQKTRPNGHKYSVSLITSRGCPYNCIFCSIHLHMGKVFRAHSADYVIKHLKYLADKYKIKHISFEDDNFTLNINRAKDILRGIIDNQIKITWDTPNGIRADRIDEELIKLMKDSGCVELVFGVESGSQRVLNEIVDKNLKISDVLKAVELSKKYKIRTKAFFVIGFPGETKEEINQTKNLLLDLRRKFKVESSPLIATPLFGTRLYQICKKQSYLTKEPDSESLSVATQPRGEGLIRTEEFDSHYLKKIASEIEKEKRRIKIRENLSNPLKYFFIIKSIILNPKRAVRILFGKF